MTNLMSDNERETDFLGHCLLYDDSGDGHQLQQRITQVKQEERCVRRALKWLLLAALLAFSGLCYSMLFMPEHPGTVSPIARQVITDTLLVFGMGSLICMLGFCIMIFIYRRELATRREQCRQMALKLLESRLGKPPGRPVPAATGKCAVTRH
jgi:hypothetical protein